MTETKQDITDELEHPPSLASLLACYEPLAALAADLFGDPEYAVDLRRRLLRLLADYSLETLLDSGDPRADMDDWLYQLLDAKVPYAVVREAMPRALAKVRSFYDPEEVAA